MCPMLRGENGNPGNYESMYAEPLGNLGADVNVIDLARIPDELAIEAAVDGLAW